MALIKCSECGKEVSDKAFEIYSKKILQDVKPGEKYKLCFKPNLFNSKPYVIKVDNII